MDYEKKELLRKAAYRAINYERDKISDDKAEELAQACEKVGYKNMALSLRHIVEQRKKDKAKDAEKKKRLYDFVNQGARKGTKAIYHRSAPSIDIEVTIQRIDPENLLLVIKHDNPPRYTYQVNPCHIDLL